MEICSSNHDEVVYSSQKLCPVCTMANDMQEIIDQKVQEYDEIEDSLEQCVTDLDNLTTLVQKFNPELLV